MRILNFDEMILNLKDFDIVLFANEREENMFQLKNIEEENIAIIVGAEGGFSEIEKEKIKSTKALSLSLGKRILRCETASVAMLSIVSILSGN